MELGYNLQESDLAQAFNFALSKNGIRLARKFIEHPKMNDALKEQLYSVLIQHPAHIDTLSPLLAPYMATKQDEHVETLSLITVSSTL